MADDLHLVKTAAPTPSQTGSATKAGAKAAPVGWEPNSPNCASARRSPGNSAARTASRDSTPVAG